MWDLEWWNADKGNYAFKEKNVKTMKQSGNLDNKQNVKGTVNLMVHSENEVKCKTNSNKLKLK